MSLKWIRRIRCLDRITPVGAHRLRPVNPRAGLEYQDLGARSCETVSDQRAGNARANDDDVRLLPLGHTPVLLRNRRFVGPMPEDTAAGAGPVAVAPASAMREHRHRSATVGVPAESVVNAGVPVSRDRCRRARRSLRSSYTPRVANSTTDAGDPDAPKTCCCPERG